MERVVRRSRPKRSSLVYSERTSVCSRCNLIDCNWVASPTTIYYRNNRDVAIFLPTLRNLFPAILNTLNSYEDKPIALPLTDIVGSGSSGKSNCRFDLDTSFINDSMNDARSLQRFDTSNLTVSVGRDNSYEE